MKRNNLLGLFAMGCVGLATACGGGGVELEELPDEITNKICQSQVECGDFPDLETCLEAGFLDVDLEGIQADIDAGVISYDEDAAQRCIDAYDALLGCELIFNSQAIDDLEAACNAVFTGTVELGGSCTESEQCAGDAGCDTEVCPDQCCSGTCVADPGEERAEIGQSCAESDCVAGAYCVGETDTCAALVEVGGACADFDACVAGALCDLDFATQMGTCAELPDEGGTCNPDMLIFQCLRTDNFCDPADTTCKPRLDVGSTCTDNECVGYARCIDGTCAARPALGESCEIDGELTCLGSLDCVNGTCTADGDDGDYCPLGG